MHGRERLLPLTSLAPTGSAQFPPLEPEVEPDVEPEVVFEVPMPPAPPLPPPPPNPPVPMGVAPQGSGQHESLQPMLCCFMQVQTTASSY